MAVYKVAQDVEADDKLIGPFSFRQFIYLLIVFGSGALAWGLSRLFIPLAIIPLPLILFFGALALPLRKDQPMEIYLAAVLSFYLKPRKRLWIPDGIDSLVEITAPRVVEIQRTKDLSTTEAERRLSYLANIVDTGGWAIRNASAIPTSTPLIGEVYNEAQRAEDMLDASGSVARSLDAMISRADQQHREAVMASMHAPAQLQMITPPPAAQPFQQNQPSFAPSANPFAVHQPVQQDDFTPPVFNPYPVSIHQSVIQPLGEEAIQAPAPPSQPQPTQPQPSIDEITPKPSENVIPPDIINLANNTDLSIETIAREAHRIERKHDMDEEVVISLR